MDQFDRELILKCYSGEQETLPILHSLYQFKFATYVFQYLLKKGITGKNLIEFYSRFNSPLKMGKYIIDQVTFENRKLKEKDLK